VSDTERAVRVTLRCLSEDLSLPVPPLGTELGSVEHPLVAEAWRVAPVAESSQDRILAISSPLVYKLRHGRWRGASWMERSTELFWLLAGGIREEGSSDDPYVHFVALHRADHLLPTDDDRLRYRGERAARFLREMRAALRDELQAARAHAGTDHRFVAAGLSLRLYVRRTDDWEEVWLAIRTVDVEGSGVAQRTRDVVFALLEELVGEAEWEVQAHWPTGTLHGCEVVRWGVVAREND
jgi:hypothetical protein